MVGRRCTKMEDELENDDLQYDSVADVATAIRDVWSEEWADYAHKLTGIRKQFHHSSKWDGGTDSMGRRHKSMWMKVAEKLFDSQIDPIKFVRAQFRFHEGAMPYPTILLTSDAEN